LPYLSVRANVMRLMRSASARPEEVAAQARVSRALNEVALAASGVLDPVELAQMVSDRARDLVGGWSATLVWFEGKKTRVLADNHPYPFPPEDLEAGRGVSGRIKQTGQVIVADDYPGWDHALQWAIDSGVASMIGVPLKVRDKLLGCLLVRSREPRFFGPELRDILLLLAAQVAPSIQAAFLSAEREKQARIFQSLHALAVIASGVLDPLELARVATERCREMLEVDGTVIFRFDGRRGALEPLNATSGGVVEEVLKPGEGAVGLAYSRRRPLAIDDYAAWSERLMNSVGNGVGACMTHPLVAGDVAIGAIGVWARETRHWTEIETQILSMVAAQVGPALAAATVADERERRAETLQALNEVAVAAAGVLEPAELAMIAAQHARDLLGASGGSICWYDEDRMGLRILADTEIEFDPGRVITVESAGAQGAAFANGEPVVVPDYATWDRRVASEVHRVASALVVPLQVRQRRIGTLAINWGEPHQFGADDVQLLTLLAAEVAPSLEAARLHEDLRESETRKRAIVESALDCMIAADEKGRIVEFNPAAENTFGHRRDQVLGKDIWEVIIPAQLREGHRVDLEKLVASPERSQGRLETTAQRSDGSRFPVEISLASFRQDGEAMFSASIRDLSERLEAEVMRHESEAKSRFVAAMSHELRTPLNSILGFSQLLAGGGTGELNERQRRYVGHIESSGRHLLALINDVLDLSKVEAGQMEVELEPIELQPLLEEAINQLRPMADLKPLDLIVEGSPQIWIRADRRRFLQVMLNLLSNAVKFTGPGGLIRITATRAGRAAEIAVTDTGIGIPESEQQRIFEEFTQVDRPSGESEGTGLGLALSRRLLQLMRGSIRVESSPGSGSTFTVIVPRIRPGEVADARPLLLVIHGEGEDPGLLTHLEMGPYRVIATHTVREAAIIARRRRVAGIIVGELVLETEQEWLREALRDHPRTHSLPILSAAVALHPGVLLRD
jgi:PAS domain S-box-containing protein